MAPLCLHISLHISLLLPRSLLCRKQLHFAHKELTNKTAPITHTVCLQSLKTREMSTQKKIHSPTENGIPNKKHRSENQLVDENECPETDAAVVDRDEQTPATTTTVSSLDMCYYCFDVLKARLYNQPAPSAPNFTNDPFPAFVTWKKGTKPNQMLRGCIGNFKALPLHEILRRLAWSSANDSRFDPIVKEELNKLTVSISLLKNFEDCSDYKDWIIGKHGVEMFYTDEAGHEYSSTFLPEVALEHNWDHKDTVLELLRKSGYSKRKGITADLFTKIRLKRYSSEKISANYQDYELRVK